MRLALGSLGALLLLVGGWFALGRIRSPDALPKAQTDIARVGAQELGDNIHRAEAAPRAVRRGVPAPLPSLSADATEGRRLLLRLQLSMGPAPSSMDLSGLTCEFGIYASREGRPPALSLNEQRGTYDFELPAGSVVLARGVSDRDGKLELGLPLPAGILDQATSPWVWTRVLSERFLPRLEHLPLPDSIGAPISFKVNCISGAVMRGRVLGKDGLPVQSGQLRFDLLADSERKISYGNGASCDKNGCFELYMKRGGPGALYAWGPGGSAGFEFDLDLQEPPQDLELRFKGASHLAGWMLDPGGRPVAGVAFRAAQVGAPNVNWATAPWRNLLMEGKGHFLQDFLTDSDGRFSLQGLRPGAYGFRRLHGEPLQLEPRQVLAGVEGLELRVPAYRLELRVEDHLGRPLQPRLFPAPARDVGHAVFCQVADAKGMIQDPRDPKRAWRERMPDGRVIFQVEPGKSYAIGVISAREALVESVLTIETGQWLTERKFRLSAPQSPVGLDVWARTADGTPMGECHEVMLQGPKSGVVLADTGQRPFSGGPVHGAESARLALSLPPGRYLASAGLAGARSLFYGSPRRDHGALQQFLMLGAGRDQELVLVLGLGARIKLGVELVGEADDQRWPGVPDPNDYRRLRQRRRGARVRLLPMEGGAALVPIFAHQADENPPWLHDSWEGDWVAPGRSVRSKTYVPAGEYVLQVRARGYAPAEMKIHVGGGGDSSYLIRLGAQ